MSELKRLQNQRRALKASLTKTVRSLQQLIQDEDVDLDIVKEKLTVADSCLIKYREVHLECCGLMEEEQLDEVVEFETEYEDGIIQGLAKVRAIVNSVTVRRDEVSREPASRSHGESRAMRAQDNATSTPLGVYNVPHVSLPKFSGQLVDWIAFIQSFDNAVNNTHLPDAVKLTLLRNHLEGEALETIKFYSLTDQNFTSALKALKERYGDENKLIEIYVEQLIDLKSKAVHLSLRQTYDQLLSIVSMLENLNVQRDQYAILLVPMLKTVFPYHVKIKWAKYERSAKIGINTEENRLTLFLRFLKEEVEILESAQHKIVPNTTQNQQQRSANYNRKVKQGESTASFQTSTTSNNPKPPPKQKGKFYRGNGEHQSSGKRLVSHSGGNRRSDNTITPPPCCFCKAKTGQHFNHHPRSCRHAESFTSFRARELIAQDGRCLRCLGPRSSTECTCNYHCYICQKAHHTLLCESRDTVPTPAINASPSYEPSGATNESVRLLSRKTTTGIQTILPMASVHITAQRQSQTRIILDTGSQRSYIIQPLVERIRAPTIANEFLGFEGFGGKREAPKDTPVVSFSLSSITSNNNQSTMHMNALVTKQITSTEFPQFQLVNTSHYSHLKDLKLADANSNNNEVGVLIGQDFLWDVLDGEIRKGKKGEPVAMNTIFGFVLSGNTHLPASGQLCNFLCKETTMCRDVETFWSLESMGIGVEKSNDEEAVETYMKTVKFKDGHYEVGLPWKPDHPPLINNKEKAQVRLDKLNKKLEKQPELFTLYEEAIQELIDEDFVEEVSNIDESTNKEFYLPHRPVIKQGTSSYKCRPVFDASAEDLNGTSLNDCLLTGPSLLPNILNILIRFRWWKHGLIGDIKRAFLQIGIQEKDRDALRFLWRGKTYRFKKVPFGLCSSPYHLNQTVKMHLLNYPYDTMEQHELLQELSQSFYVDDLIMGADSHEELLYKLIRSFDVMKAAGMSLRNWTSSDNKLHTDYGNQYDFSDAEECSVLGLYWNRTNDTLRPKVPTWDVKWALTKRNILSHLAQIFDPLGWLSPLTIQGKLIVQKLWKESIDWDATVPTLIQNATTEFAQNCIKLQSLSFPRTFRSLNSNAPLSLHVYCDASNQACGTVVYSRQEDQSHIIAAKTKVAPLNSKTMSLPRLELIACLMGVRLAKTVKKTDPYHNLPVHFYSDSNVALSWISSGVGNKSQREIFINNRVREILLTTKSSDWNYIPTKENPADLMTRENSINRLMTHEGLELWIHGPTCHSHMPCVPDENPSGNDTTDNTRDEDKISLMKRVHLTTTTKRETILDLTRYNNLRKVLKITAYVMRFKNRITKSETQHSKTVVAGTLHQAVPTPSLDELERAKQFWLKFVQQIHYSEEMKLLEMNGQIPKSSSLHPLKPVLTEEGLLKSIGRTQNRPPILLPQRDPFTNLIVKDIHDNNFHAGVNFTLCQLRQTFWIIKGRQTVKRIINDCLICKRHRALPYRQIAAPLPSCRITEQRPFETVGMDFCGPFYVTEGKAYILIFSCAVTRACHLELTPDMSTNSVIQGLRRMTSRRGRSRLIICDNARSFQKLRQSLQSDIRFYFIPPYSPWFGGFYERLNSSIKSALKKSLGRNCLSFQELHTLLTEVESFINHRPITHVTDDTGDPLPLRPIDFIHTPGPLQQSSSATQERLALRFKHHKTILESVWKQWRQQYLHQLHKWDQHKIRCSEKEPNIGDVVMINPFTVTNKALFPLGRITDVVRGNDGMIRSIYIKTDKGVIHRSTKHVYPLESEGNGIPFPTTPPISVRDQSTDPEVISSEGNTPDSFTVPSAHSPARMDTKSKSALTKRHDDTISGFTERDIDASNHSTNHEEESGANQSVTNATNKAAAPPTLPLPYVTRHGRSSVRPVRFLQ